MQAELDIDWCITPQFARELTDNKITLQGNFDPAKLLAPIPQIKKWVKEMIDGFGTPELYCQSWSWHYTKCTG